MALSGSTAGATSRGPRNTGFSPRSSTTRASPARVPMNGWIQAVSGATTFSNLTIASTGVSLGSNITVLGTLQFTSGVINTSSSKLSIGSSGTVTGAAAGRYVNGNLEKTLIPSGGNVAAT